MPKTGNRELTLCSGACYIIYCCLTSFWHWIKELLVLNQARAPSYTPHRLAACGGCHPASQAAKPVRAGSRQPSVTHFCDQYIDIGVFADRTADSAIRYWHDNVCLSDRTSVMLCIVAKRYVLQQNCLNKCIGSALIGTRFYNFQPPTLTLCPQTQHLVHNRCRCYLANKFLKILRAVLPIYLFSP